jgi:hypothetical protein
MPSGNQETQSQPLKVIGEVSFAMPLLPDRRLGTQARTWLLIKNPSQDIVFGTALVTFDSCGAFRAARRTRPDSGSAVAVAWY